MHDDQPEVFQAYLTLVYTDTVENDPETPGYPYPGLIKLFILADKLHDLVAASKVMDETLAIPSKINCFPNTSAIRLAYWETARGEPMQRLMAQLYVHGPNDLPNSSQLMSLPREFLADVASSFMGVKNHFPNSSVKQTFSQETSPNDRCRYHLHNAEYPDLSLIHI